MSWRVYGEELMTADFTGSLPRVAQKVRFNQDFVLRAVRSWFVVLNAPAFTRLEMRVHANDVNALAVGTETPVSAGGVAGDLLHTFDKVWAPADLYTQPHAVKEIYFDFTLPRFMKAGDSYWFAPWLVGYTGNSSSHVAWRRSANDANNVSDIVVTTANLNRAPYFLGFIGDRV